MPMSSFSYTSVHDYLDDFFKEINNPTAEMIARAKKEYWRMYNSDLKRRQRKKNTVVHLNFPNEELAFFKSKIAPNKKVHSKIKDIISDFLQNEPLPKMNTALLEQQVFMISQYISLWREEKTVDLIKLEQLEQCIITLEKALNE